MDDEIGTVRSAVEAVCEERAGEPRAPGKCADFVSFGGEKSQAATGIKGDSGFRIQRLSARPTSYKDKTMSRKAIQWSGVFPAVTTQFNADFSLNLQATHKVMRSLVDDGVSGLVVCGTVGENTSLTTAEKLAVIEVAKDAAGGRVPVIAGVAEFTTEFARNTVREAARAGADGVMVMPALVYSAKPHETAAHFRAVATGTDLPVMVYNNPPIYKNDVTPDVLIALQDCENIVCFKDSSGDTRRFIDLRNAVGDRFVLFAGLDDVVVESVAVGAEGWVSGMSVAFPKEGETLFRLAKEKRFEEALALYRWFMPLLHLDARPDLVQCIKLCEELVGRGSSITRPPRLPLQGETLAEVKAIVAKALATRPSLPNVGL
ncbi:dihydrodipicolinate synthase DapA [Pseudomonas protegens CHA0]|uniref:Dihydrodipicolinate synthase DapA n=3 Tax=Pseudomonas protegens TaxID=380021 RepID=A0A2C9EHW7_PSEPH|nr:dihydrodipicolinate synthase DapA [Pseudomonas protegens CHA0]